MYFGGGNKQVELPLLKSVILFLREKHLGIEPSNLYPNTKNIENYSYTHQKIFF